MYNYEAGTSRYSLAAGVVHFSSHVTARANGPCGTHDDVFAHDLRLERLARQELYRESDEWLSS